MKTTMRKTGSQKGSHFFTVDKFEGNGKCSLRRYRIGTDDKGLWEVAIWDNELRSYVLSSGQTPEGTFRRLKDAVEALKHFAKVR